METTPANKKKTRCPNGTKRNKKTGNCDPIKNEKQKTPVFTMKTNKVTGEKTKVKLVIEQEPVVEQQTGIKDKSIEDKLNELKNKMELKEREEFIKQGTSPIPYLYPNLNDPNFNINIAERKEFHDTQYDGEVKPVEEEAEIMCNADFELAPHQLFVRNFLSFQTPYNSLLLYHGLGSGKTCSAISIAEEMRDYLIQMNISNRIIIVASPNVQDNFKLQLFDERKLKLIDGIWNIRSCTGNKFLKEINPMNMKGLTKETVISQVKRIINTYYVFLGYTEFANYIQKKSTISDDITDQKRRAALIKNKLKQQFSNRLIIIDEVHNIRISDDKSDKKRVAQELFKLVRYADNMRLLLLSATPMYNSYKEIIWLVNIMNLNDRRSTIEIKDVFNTDGTFKTSASGEPVGKDLLVRKATGYISYVRGENPYTFPYKLWPDEFAPDKTFLEREKPLVQLNGKPLLQNIAFLSLYLNEIGEYQNKGYAYVLSKLKQKQEFKKTTAFDQLEAFGYTMLQKPLEALNMIYPEDKLTNVQVANAVANAENIDIADLVGSGGLKRMMTFTETVSPPAKYDFEYKPSSYGRIFSPNEIGKYSSKIKSICDRVLNSTGVILVYSEYIDGGVLPIALALEELGFTRAGNVRSLFKTPPSEKIDALSKKPKKDMADKKDSFNPAKYVMITGDKGLSPDNVKDISLLTDINNKDGNLVKVVLISLAGSEGLDLKFIRQVHILDPWYNMNRIEQIIGRAVRTCSHKDLPFLKRNVELYLYGTLLPDKREEAVDLYVYRLAELKAIQIGNVSRTIKEIAVDCILNYQQGNFTVENMKQSVNLELSSGGNLNYAIGDKPYSAICDYMQKCSYTCKPSSEASISEASVSEASVSEASIINTDTYSEAFIMQNNDKIIYKIKQLFKERFFYRKSMLITMINIVKTYPLMQINAALNQLIEDKNEYLSDKYGRLGNLINIGDLYLFQPLELTNPNIGLLERSMPVEFTHDSISIDLSNLKAEEHTNKPIIKKPSKAKGLDVEEVVKVISKTDILIDKIRAYYNLAIVPNKPKRGEDNWYKFCSEVIDEMMQLGLERNSLLDALVSHICDELTFEDKMLLLNNFANISDKDEFIERIERYLLKDRVINKSITGLLVQNKGVNNLYIKRTTSPTSMASTTSTTWSLAEAEDKYDLEQPITAWKNKLIPAKEKLHSIVGFMSNFKKEESNIVFKVKVFTLKGIVKKRNKGARCYGKSVETMEEIMGPETLRTYLDLIKVKYKDIIEEKKKNRGLNKTEEGVPDELEAITQIHACVIQEMFLRYYNIQNKDSRHWFLSPEEAVLIDIENLSY